MALTVAQIIASMRLRGINTDLSDAEITEAISAWLAIIRFHCGVETLGTFQTVAGQQEYDLFGVGKPFEGGLDVLEVYGSSGCSDSAGVDVFGLAPLIQGFGMGVLYHGDGSYSHSVPGDAIMADRLWSAWRARFNALTFVLKEGRNGSPILLIPTPTSVFTVMARYRRPSTDSEALAELEDAVLLNGVEWRSLELLARKYAMTGGVKIGEHEDKGFTAKMFWDMAKAKEKDAMRGLSDCVSWTISAADRS